MAECEGTLEGETSPELKKLTQQVLEMDINDNIGCFGRPGAQLEDKLEFKGKDGKSFWAYPILVNFRQLLKLGQDTENTGIIPGISNKDLLHAVVGLYDVCLSDMSPDCIYDTICQKGAKTVLLVRDREETVKDMTERRQKKKQEEQMKPSEEDQGKETEESEEEEEDSEEDSESEDDAEIDPDYDVLEEEDETPSRFQDVYSDTENEEEEEDDDEEEDEDEEEQDFTKGIHTFIRKCRLYRQERESLEEEDITVEQVHIENMLLGCASFEKKYVCHQREKVIHLTFIGVRPRARKLQMGRYLLSKCMDPTVTGNYEAVVVHADASAVQFFTKFGFTDDILLNSKWSELAEQFTQCTLMCYVPGFSVTGTAMVEATDALKRDPDICEIEEELKKWQQKSLEAYQSQVLCMRRLQHEVMLLKCLLKKQTDLVDKLLEDNEQHRENELLAECEPLIRKMETARCAFQTMAGSEIIGEQKKDNGDNIETHHLNPNLEKVQPTAVQLWADVLTQGKQLSLPSNICDKNHKQNTEGSLRQQAVSCSRSDDVTIFLDTIVAFKQAMSADSSVLMQYEVTSIVKAVLPKCVLESFHSQISRLSEPSMVTELYFCGTLGKPHRCQEILSAGFSTEDFSHGEYGSGLYFSKYPSKAAQFSTLGKLILAKVGLGEVETVTTEDKTRREPANGSDSILCPGRLHQGAGDSLDITLSQEYVIFNPTQLLPICLVTYRAVS